MHPYTWYTKILVDVWLNVQLRLPTKMVMVLSIMTKDSDGSIINGGDVVNNGICDINDNSRWLVAVVSMTVYVLFMSMNLWIKR